MNGFPDILERDCTPQSICRACPGLAPTCLCTLISCPPPHVAGPPVISLSSKAHHSLHISVFLQALPRILSPNLFFLPGNPFSIIYSVIRGKGWHLLWTRHHSDHFICIILLLTYGIYTIIILIFQIMFPMLPAAKWQSEFKLVLTLQSS